MGAREESLARPFRRAALAIDPRRLDRPSLDPAVRAASRSSLEGKVAAPRNFSDLRRMREEIPAHVRPTVTRVHTCSDVFPGWIWGKHARTRTRARICDAGWRVSHGPFERFMFSVSVSWIDSDV